MLGLPTSGGKAVLLGTGKRPLIVHHEFSKSKEKNLLPSFYLLKIYLFWCDLGGPINILQSTLLSASLKSFK